MNQKQHIYESKTKTEQEYGTFRGYTGWSTSTGLIVVSRATFHSRNMSMALAPATRAVIIKTTNVTKFKPL